MFYQPVMADIGIVSAVTEGTPGGKDLKEEEGYESDRGWPRD